MKLSTSGMGQQTHEGENQCLNSELWHACAGPLVCLPAVGTRVVYFPQGHSEQVAATTNKEVDVHMPNYPSLPPQMICQLHNITMHADIETDEVYAQMTLQPLTPQEQKDTFLPVELGIPNKQPTNYFCKTLTASDTSTHGGFSVPRRAAEKVFPPLDFTQQPPCQELIARDLHDVEWKFRHIFRGQPKRHLLTTGWSVFVSAKRLVAGDSVLFIWNEKNQLLLGIRRAVRPQTVMPSSVLSSDSMHIGLLAAAAHAAATNSCFTIFYNPRASPSEFVIPLSKYAKAVFHTRVSVGMRFRMLFETEESSVRRYMGTITSIGDLDPVRWPNSHWRSVKVGWDESTAGERQPRVSLWEIEPLTTFPMYPSLFPLRLKRPWFPGASSFQDSREGMINGMTWLRGEGGEQALQAVNFQNAGIFPWNQSRMDPAYMRNELNQQYQAILSAGLQNIDGGDSLKEQYLQLQQPFQYAQPLVSQNSLLQQQVQTSVPSHILQAQAQMLPENLTRHMQQVNNQADEQSQQHSYHNGLMLQGDQLQQRDQRNVSSPSYLKIDFTGSSSKFSTSVAPCLQNMLGSLSAEGSGDPFNFSRTGQSVVNDSSQQPWVSKITHPQVYTNANSVSLPAFPGRDTSSDQETYAAGGQNHVFFGANMESGLLPATFSNIGTTSANADMSQLPLEASGFQSSLFGCVQESSKSLHSETLVDSSSPTRTYVKVYKSGSVGRSLDISQFNSYHELREELGRMFAIEGLLEDPQRSGWQLVFVDRENDILLLGDDPWEAFVNNVWYIKILSPEDVQKLGDQEIGSYSLNPSGGTDNGGGDARDIGSGLHSVGSLEY